eukprot:357940-Chlamydomonas_euryale.AAC.3
MSGRGRVGLGGGSAAAGGPTAVRASHPCDSMRLGSIGSVARLREQSWPYHPSRACVFGCEYACLDAAAAAGAA